MVIPWFMSIRHRNFPFLIKKCSMLMVQPSAFDVAEQSYGKFGRIYSLNYLQNNSQNYGIETPTALLLTFIRREFEIL